MTTNTDKPKKLRNFSVSKNFSQVHTILNDIDKQERSRFICEAIIEKFNNMNKEQKTNEPMEQMKQMMEQYQMITSLINPMQQSILNPAVMQMMQQPAYQQPILDPAILAQMQTQAYAQQVAQQVHTPTPVQPVQDTTTVETAQVEPLQVADETEQTTKNATSPIEEKEESSFKPQRLFSGDSVPIEEKTETSTPVEKTPEETAVTAIKNTPAPKEDKRLAGRRRGGLTRQFMQD
ncbi:hypothetical protein ABD91_20415 [Lysinibacillus sphaericus]|uniref:hypothetical protein n=1 Tax=Lysinibacillus sphaericus TaxID=1421 RepID=UPI0018CD3E7A|nr:hypothetical protein [Lysinibacillus sphaericus]MBG9693112.1 hypothetical protein [Lysinibacillus sphaericus]